MFRITEDTLSGSLLQCLAEIIKMVQSCSLTWMWSVLWQQYAAITPTIYVIFAKHCTRLPDDGSSVIRNMLEHF